MAQPKAVGGSSTSSGSLVLRPDAVHDGGSSSSTGGVGIIRALLRAMTGASTSSGVLVVRKNNIIAEGYVRLYYNSTSVDLRVRAVKGIHDPEYFDLYPAIVNVYLDGSKSSQFKAFRRKIRIDFGVVAAWADREKILLWMLDNDRKIGYEWEYDISVVPQNADGYENEWLENISIARKYVFELDETSVRTTFPTDT